MADEIVAAVETPKENVAEADANASTSTGAGSAPAVASTGDEVDLTEKAQNRIDKLTREKYDALREADYWRDRAQKVQEPEPKPQAAAPAPTLEAFDFDQGKYQVALIEFARQQAREEAKTILEKERSERQTEARRQMFDKRQAEFTKSKPDYAAKVLNNPLLAITHEMADVIMESEIGPEIAYYLAENETRARNIAILPPISQAREIGRIEAMLEAAKVKPVKPAVSQAPPPTPKLDATEPAIEKEPREMTDKEYAKWRSRQIAQRKGYRRV